MRNQAHVKERRANRGRGDVAAAFNRPSYLVPPGEGTTAQGRQAAISAAFWALQPHGLDALAIRVRRLRPGRQVMYHSSHPSREPPCDALVSARSDARDSLRA